GRAGRRARCRSRWRPAARSSGAARSLPAGGDVDPKCRRRSRTARRLRRTGRHHRSCSGLQLGSSGMTSTANSIDTARVELLLHELRLPGVKAILPKLAAQSDKERWPAARFLAALAEHDAADRSRRRIERHMAEARLPARRSLRSTDSVPMISKAQVMALASGDVWLKTGANLLLFGPPGGGK